MNQVKDSRIILTHSVTIVFFFLFSCIISAQSITKIKVVNIAPCNNCEVEVFQNKEQVKKTFYYPDSTLKAVELYNLDMLYDGYCEWYHENGKFKQEGKFRQGKQVGTHTWYYDNGKVKAVGNFKNGKKHGPYKWFDESGIPYRSTKFKNDKLHGLDSLFYSDGTLMSVKSYKKGNIHGDYLRYYKNGVLEFKAPYKKGYDSGQRFIWNNEGKPQDGLHEVRYDNHRFVTNCDDGIPNGPFTVYCENEIVAEGQYTHGRTDGERKIFKNGILDQIEVYEMGKLISIDDIDK